MTRNILKYLFLSSRLNNIDITILVFVSLLIYEDPINNWYIYLLYLFPWLFISSAIEIYLQNEKSKTK